MKKECNIFVPLGCYNPCLNNCISHDKPKHPKNICTEVCGNFLLHEDIDSVIIWENQSYYKNLVTICVFNSSNNQVPITVHLQTDIGETISFIVPPGNSSARTISNLKLASIICIKPQHCQGNYELNICTV